MTPLRNPGPGGLFSRPVTDFEFLRLQSISPPPQTTDGPKRSYLNLETPSHDGYSTPQTRMIGEIGKKFETTDPIDKTSRPDKSPEITPE